MELTIDAEYEVFPPKESPKGNWGIVISDSVDSITLPCAVHPVPSEAVALLDREGWAVLAEDDEGYPSLVVYDPHP